MSDAPRIAVLGAGSVGCFVGGAWKMAGLCVSLIGRPKLAHDVDQHGLTLSDYSGWQAHLPRGEIEYHCDARMLADADVIVVAVKSDATAQAAIEIDKHGRKGATVISFQNGISNVEALEKELGGRFQLARGMVPFNIVYLGNGHFHKGVAGDLWADRTPDTQALSERVTAGPAALRLSDQMLELAWGKLLINLNNAVNALSGKTLIGELRERDYRRVFAASISEGLKLLKRANVKPATVGPIGPDWLPRVIDSPDWLFNNIFLRRWKIDAKARSSMADDLAAGRKTEVEYLNGELVRLARQAGVSAPVNRAIVELVHEAEAGAPPLTAKALRRAALGR